VLILLALLTTVVVVGVGVVVVVGVVGVGVVRKSKRWLLELWPCILLPTLHAFGTMWEQGMQQLAVATVNVIAALG
jgi:hypothetical protein